LKKGCEGKH